MESNSNNKNHFNPFFNAILLAILLTLVSITNANEETRYFEFNVCFEILLFIYRVFEIVYLEVFICLISAHNTISNYLPTYSKMLIQVIETLQTTYLHLFKI